MIAPAARSLAPTLAALAGAAAYLAVAPATADLAAHEYRAWLFDREGFAIWNANWYGGHHVPAYSALFPPLAALVGPRPAGAAAAVAAVALAAPLLRNRPLAHWLLAGGVLASLWVGRMPFVLGIAFGVAAWAARPRSARAVLALGCGLASPVAGLFLALLAVPKRDAWLGTPAIAGPLALALLFPEGGSERFVASAFWPMLAISVTAAWLLRGRLREAAALNVALLAAAFALETAVGHNATRLAATLGPMALAIGAPRARAALAIGAALVYLQWLPAVRAVAEAHGDPSVAAAFHAPAADFLAPRLRPGERVEIVFTRNHWEAAHLAKRLPLARGWERQLDRRHNALFYDGGLSEARYRRWLRENAIAYVALPEAPLDFSARAEATLVERWPRPTTLPGWRIWEVPGRRPPVLRQASLQGFSTRAAGATGQRWSRYWSVVSGRGCIRRGAGGWTVASGAVSVGARLRAHRCSHPRGG